MDVGNYEADTNGVTLKDYYNSQVGHGGLSHGRGT